MVSSALLGDSGCLTGTGMKSQHSLLVKAEADQTILLTQPVARVLGNSAHTNGMKFWIVLLFYSYPLIPTPFPGGKRNKNILKMTM